MWSLCYRKFWHSMVRSRVLKRGLPDVALNNNVEHTLSMGHSELKVGIALPNMPWTDKQIWTRSHNMLHWWRNMPQRTYYSINSSGWNMRRPYVAYCSLDWNRAHAINNTMKIRAEYPHPMMHVKHKEGSPFPTPPIVFDAEVIYMYKWTLHARPRRDQTIHTGPSATPPLYPS